MALEQLPLVHDSTSVQARAAFAVAARLVACLVTESLLPAYFLPLPSPTTEDVIGVAVLLAYRPEAKADVVDVTQQLSAQNVFVVVPLKHVPVLKQKETAVIGTWRRIALVDPLDMQPAIYEVTQSNGFPAQTLLQQTILKHANIKATSSDCSPSLRLTLDPIRLWHKFADDYLMQESLSQSIAQELASSRDWQEHAFSHPPQRPTLASPALEFEQSLVEGHPTHPMHRARRTLPPIPAYQAGDYDYYSPRIRLVSVPLARLRVQGALSDLLTPLVREAQLNAGRDVPAEFKEGRFLMPVHELQTPNVVAKFPDVKILPEEFSVQAQGQASIRTVVSSCVPDLAIKLAVGLKISSALRTISHFTADIGPRFSQHIVPRLNIDRSILSIETEPASAVIADADPEKAKHLTVVLRNMFVPMQGEKVVVCASLLESGHEGGEPHVPLVISMLGLDTDAKRLAFFDRYARLALDALIPPMVVNGVAFEAHPQNTLARFSSSGELLGFVIRDLGGLRLHPPTLRSSTGLEDFTFLPEHCIVTDSVEEAYKKLYHTLMHNHLQRLVRLLGLFHDGRGWAIVRAHLDKIIPENSTLRTAWLDEEKGAEVDGKCLLRMKIEGVYRDSVYAPVPNLIQFRPQV